MPEVPSEANFGLLPALSPDWTLSSKLVSSGGTTSKSL